MKATIAKKRQTFKKENCIVLQPFTKLIPVGFAKTSDETVAVVLAGDVGKYNDEFLVTGEWFAVRVGALFPVAFVALIVILPILAPRVRRAGSSSKRAKSNPSAFVFQVFARAQRLTTSSKIAKLDKD